VDVAAARRHLEHLAAEPRPAGSAAEARARAYCAARLRELGFSVQEEPFQYSALPGRLATPLAGLASVMLLLGAAAAGSSGRALFALAVLAVGGVSLALGALWLMRRGVLTLPWRRSTGVNLVARRAEPRTWLVAHLDSKSQPVPIAVRALGVMASIVVWVAAYALAAAQLFGADVARMWPWIDLVGLVAGLPVIASVVRERSPGALDNASGVATVLRAVEQLAHEQPLGVLLTSAEELGLAGARSWVRDRPRGTAVNVDGVDDVGALRLIYSGRRPRALLATLADAAHETGKGVHSGPLLPGVLLDGVAFADAGWDVVTVSKGVWRTVTRIHTPRDSLSSLTGQGVAEAADTVARAARELH
jgi:Peptidase family M28